MLAGGLHAGVKRITILTLHHFSQARSDPFGDRRCHRITYGMIAKAVDPIALTIIEVSRLRPIIGEPLNALNLVRCETPHSAFRIPHIVP